MVYAIHAKECIGFSDADWAGDLGDRNQHLVTFIKSAEEL